MHVAKTSTSPSDCICRFLSIPRELRDVIYSYALSEPKGLFYRYEENIPKNQDKTFKLFSSIEPGTSDTAIEANQLKYVCRQLFKETAGLGLKYNDVNFIRTSRRHSVPLIQFLDFAKCCAPRKLQQIRTVHCRTSVDVIDADEDLDDSTGDIQSATIKSMNKVVAFCAAHPKLKVCYHLAFSGWTQHPEIFVFVGIYQVIWSGRNFGELFIEPFCREFQQGAIAVNDGKTLKPGELPRNFEIWMPDDDGFDEDEFRKVWSSPHERVDSQQCVSNFKGGLDGMVEEVRRWYHKGVLAQL